MTIQFRRLFLVYFVLKSVSGITKCDRLLLQGAWGITKCDRLCYKVRQVLQSVTVVTKWDVIKVSTCSFSFYVSVKFYYSRTMQLVSKITLATFDFNKHLIIHTFSRAILANILLASRILLLFHNNKLQNMRKLENISHIALGTVR